MHQPIQNTKAREQSRPKKKFIKPITRKTQTKAMHLLKPKKHKALHLNTPIAQSHNCVNQATRDSHFTKSSKKSPRAKPESIRDGENPQITSSAYQLIQLNEHHA